MLTSSHTHCGPVLSDALYDIYPLDEKRRARIEAYSRKLEQQMVETVREAFSRLTLTLDQDRDGGLLAEMFAIPQGECRFAEYVKQDDLVIFMTVQNFAGHLELILDQLAKPEFAEMMEGLPLDENGDLANRFGIRSIPTLVVFKGGKVVDQLIGAAPIEQIRDLVCKHFD